MNTAAVAKWLADAFEEDGWRSWRKKEDHSVEQQSKGDFELWVRDTLARKVAENEKG